MIPLAVWMHIIEEWVKRLLDTPCLVIIHQIDCKPLGIHVKILSIRNYLDVNIFAFYSKARGYEEGIKENLEMMPKLYPGWIMRLYTNYNITDQMFGKLCNLACHYPFLDICHVEDLPG